MLKTIIVGFFILGIILFFVFGIVGPIFSKKKKTEEKSMDDIDEMVQNSEKIANAKEIITGEVVKKERKINRVKNNLKK